MPTLSTYSHLAHRPEIAALIDQYGAEAVIAAAGEDDPRYVSPLDLRCRLAGQTVETIADMIAVAQEHAQDTNIALCPQGDHLRVARRWRRTCARCGEPISHGNVGRYTWDDDRTCGKGACSYQHGCGEWNSPVEVTVDPGDYPSIEAAVSDAIEQLDNEIGAGQHVERQEIEARLTAEMTEWLRILPEQQRKHPRLADYDFPEWELLQRSHAEGLVSLGSDTEPGVVYESGEWIAWDYDPYAPDEDTIDVRESDLA